MSQTVINDVPPYTQATATLNQVIFGTNWTANAASDVVVYSRIAGSTPNDVLDILSYPSQFSVAFVGALAQVQVTLVTPSLAGDIVTVTRQTPADRQNLYTNTNFTPSMLNNDFGILTLVDQQAQLADQLIGPRYNYSAVIAPNLSFPNANTRLPILGANQIWVKNNANTAIIALDVPASGFAPQNATYITLTDFLSVLPNSQPLSASAAGLIINDPSNSQVLTTTMTGTTSQITVLNGNGLGGAINVAIASNPIIPGSAGMGIPIGTTGQRIVPVSNINLRFNTDLDSIEYFSSGVWNQLADNTDGDVNPGLINQLAYYAATGNTVSGLSTGNNGLLVTSNTGVPSILAGPGTTGQVLQSNAAAAPSFSTASYPSTTTINQLLYSSAANTVVGLATGNSGVLITSTGGVPSISSTLPNAVQVNITALGAQSQALDMNSHLINNVTDPVSTQDAATKNYVDKTALNGTSVYAATTTNLSVTQSGAGVGATLTDASGTFAVLTLDGAAVPLGQNFLVKNLAAPQNQGIYTLTTNGDGISIPWQGTRATSYDTATEINNTGLIIVQNGSTLAGTAWYNAATIVTVDTTAFSYNQFGNITFPVTLANGGTGTSLTASNGGIVYSNATTLAILSGTATAGQILRSGASSAPSWSTATYPATASTSGNVLTSDGTNWLSSTPGAVDALTATSFLLMGG